jgi:hypothetical protein
MSFFSKARRTLVPSSVIADLPEYGQADIEARRIGHPPDDPRFGWRNFAGPVHMPMINGNREEVIRELFDVVPAAAPDGGLATLRLTKSTENGGPSRWVC